MAKSKRLKKDKDFDMEKMYRKIMPSGSLSGEKTESSAVKAPAPQPPPPQDIPQPPARASLHNFMEDMVLEKLDRTMSVLDACTCDRCKNDIIALALNQLPASYAVAEHGDEKYIKKLKGAYEVKVTASLIRAIQQVKLSPRHDSNLTKD